MFLTIFASYHASIINVDFMLIDKYGLSLSLFNHRKHTTISLQNHTEQTNLKKMKKATLKSIFFIVLLITLSGNSLSLSLSLSLSFNFILKI
jgi:hypothetical protein